MTYFYIVLAIAALFAAANWILPLIHVSRNEYSRKIIHSLTAIGFFALPYFLDKEKIIFTCFIFLCALIFSKYSNLLPGIHKVERKTHGELLYPIAVGLSAYFFLPLEQSAFQFGVLVLGLSDGAAEVVGRTWGHKKLPLIDSKTWVGSSAFFAMTLAIFLVLILPAGNHSLIDGVIIALVLTIVEAIFTIGLDNLFLPLIAALLLRLLT
jgi:phytol kinase